MFISNQLGEFSNIQRVNAHSLNTCTVIFVRGVATYSKNASAYTFGPNIWEDYITVLMDS